MLEELQRRVEERNAIETAPFLSVHAANAALQSLVDTLQERCEGLEKEVMEQQHQLDEISEGTNGRSNKRLSAALKTEARLRDKIEKLQEELNEKLRECRCVIRTV